MGNGCSVFKINKYCIDGDINILVEQEEEQNNNSKNNPNLKNIKNNNNTSLKKQGSLYSNGIKINNEQNYQNNSNSSHINHIQSKENSITENNIPKSNFTNFMADLDISFTNNNNGLAQNDIFNINYINIKTEYNEEIIDYINKIRLEPTSIINDIDNLLNNANNLGDKIQIESEETHENINLDDGGKALQETKKFLNKIAPGKNKFDLNDDLYIEVSDYEKNMDTPLDKKITKILMDKRKNIIEKYPNCQFFINFIKDKKCGLLYLLSQNESMTNFRNILFDDNYTQFNVTWIKEKKKTFIAFLCFA